MEVKPNRSQLMDNNSSIYVREKGKLRRVGDIVLAQSSPQSSCRRTNPFILRKEHFKFTYNEEGSLRYSTKSLFDIALLFVVDNIHHVDSLVGFPGQIGGKLFKAAEENQAFSNSDTSPKALRLFSDAYGELLLRSLCLRNRFALLHERMNEIKMFHSLKSLDLFGCRLGDNHELFQHLTSPSLAQLSHLFVGGNNLSDTGLQRLTAPIRMMQKGLDGLQLLDISYNPISERALRYLTCLPQLSELNVSETRMKICSGLQKTMREMLGLILSHKPLHSFNHSECKTEGWAEQVVNQWEIDGLQMPKQKKMEQSRMSALRFFGRQKYIRDVMSAAPAADGCAETEASREKLHFYRPTERSHAEEKPLLCTMKDQAETNPHKTKRRIQESGKRDVLHQSPPRKRAFPTALTAEDMNLLNNY